MDKLPKTSLAPPRPWGRRILPLGTSAASEGVGRPTARTLHNRSASKDGRPCPGFRVGELHNPLRDQSRNHIESPSFPNSVGDQQRRTAVWPVLASTGALLARPGRPPPFARLRLTTPTAPPADARRRPTLLFASAAGCRLLENNRRENSLLQEHRFGATICGDTAGPWAPYSAGRRSKRDCEPYKAVFRQKRPHKSLAATMSLPEFRGDCRSGRCRRPSAGRRDRRRESCPISLRRSSHVRWELLQPFAPR